MFFTHKKARKIKAWQCSDAQIARSARTMCNIAQNSVKHRNNSRMLCKAIGYAVQCNTLDNKHNR